MIKRAIQLTLLVALAAGLSSCTASRRLNYLALPDEAAPAAETVDVQAYEQKYGNEEGVFLLVEKSIEHSGSMEKGFLDSGRWEFSQVERRRYIVFEPDDEFLTTFKIRLTPDQLYIRVTTPDGRVRSYGLDDLKEEKDSDGDTWRTVVLPDIVRGTLVETGWDWAVKLQYGTPPLEHDVPLQFAMPCEKLTFTYAYPDWWKVRQKEIRPGYTIPLVKTRDVEGKKSILSYEATDIPGLESEPYAPFFKEVAEYLQIHVTRLQMVGRTYERDEDWQDYTEGFQKNVLKKAGKNVEKLAETAREITRGCGTDLEKVDAILTWVQGNIDAGGEHRDGDYKKVLDERSGSAFDVTGLTQALLAHAGLPAWFLLVHSADEGYFDPDYIANSQFRTPAVRVDVGDESLVLIPFIENLPLNHTPRWLQGQKALQMTAGVHTESWDLGSSFETGTGTLWDVPQGNRGENDVSEVYELVIDEDGGVMVTESRTVRGAFAFEMRSALEDLDEEEERDFVEELLTYTDGDVRLDSYEILDRDAYRKPLRIEMRYAVDNLVMVTPDEVVFQTGGLLAPLTRVERRLDAAERVNPIHIDFEEEHDKDITIRHPAGWTVATELADIVYENDFGSIEGRYAIGDGVVRIDQTLRLNRVREDRSRFGELLELIGRKTRLHVPAIIFSRGSEQAAVGDDEAGAGAL